MLEEIYSATIIDACYPATASFRDKFSHIFSAGIKSFLCTSQHQRLYLDFSNAPRNNFSLFAWLTLGYMNVYCLQNICILHSKSSSHTTYIYTSFSSAARRKF